MYGNSLYLVTFFHILNLIFWEYFLWKTCLTEKCSWYKLGLSAQHDLFIYSINVCIYHTYRWCSACSTRTFSINEWFQLCTVHYPFSECRMVNTVLKRSLTLLLWSTSGTYRLVIFNRWVARMPSCVEKLKYMITWCCIL